MKRILVIGSCGSGKSTLSALLSTRLHLPLCSLDRLQWRPGWQPDLSADFDLKLEAILGQDQWIIDGNCFRTLSRRLQRSDCVIFLDFSPLLCLWRTIRRTVRWHGKERPGMADGCPERFDWRFLSYIWHFRRDTKPRIEMELKAYAGPLICLKTPRDIVDFLATVVPSTVDCA